MKQSISHLGAPCTSMAIGIKRCPLLKPSIFGDLSNGIKFHICTCWSINGTWSHHLPHKVSNHYIGNKDLIL
jgi:hypothetical protein